jgi:hypothetical protein
MRLRPHRAWVGAALRFHKRGARAHCILQTCTPRSMIPTSLPTYSPICLPTCLPTPPGAHRRQAWWVVAAPSLTHSSPVNAALAHATRRCRAGALSRRSVRMRLDAARRFQGQSLHAPGTPQRSEGHTQRSDATVWRSPAWPGGRASRQAQRAAASARRFRRSARARCIVSMCSSALEAAVTLVPSWSPCAPQVTRRSVNSAAHTVAHAFASCLYSRRCAPRARARGQGSGAAGSRIAPRAGSSSSSAVGAAPALALSSRVFCHSSSCIQFRFVALRA